MEKLISWKKEYEVGVYEIDAEHKIFLKTVQKIHDAYLNNLNPEFIESLIMELYKYADFHFICEENIMKRNRYPDYENHKKEHESLLFKLSEVIGSYNIKYINHKDFMEFLLKWFKEHTSKSDTKLGIYLRGEGIR